jgi:hypothetical protein
MLNSYGSRGSGSTSLLCATEADRWWEGGGELVKKANIKYWAKAGGRLTKMRRTISFPIRRRGGEKIGQKNGGD